MWPRRQVKPFFLVLVAGVLVLLYVVHLHYSSGQENVGIAQSGQAQSELNNAAWIRDKLPPVSRMEVARTARRGPRPSLSPFLDIEKIAKTEPTQGKLQIKVEDMNFLRQNGIPSTKGEIPEDSVLKSWTLRQLSYFYHSYLDNIQLLCERMMKMGSFFPWGNFVCDDEAYRPQKPCLAYTFLLNRADALFEDDLVRLYGCKVFMFGPGDKLKHSEQVTHSTESLQSSSLSKIKESLGHKDAPVDVLRLDLGGEEWQVLAKMAAAGELSQVRQLLLSLTTTADSNQDPATLVQRLNVLKTLKTAGFRSFRTILREEAAKVDGVYLVVRTVTYEVGLVNTQLHTRLSSNGQPTSLASKGELDMEFLRHLKTPLGTLPSWEELEKMPEKDVHFLYHRYSDNPTYHCNLVVKLGQLIDGGYRVCDDEPYRPTTSNCLVYSFGIKQDFTFDDDAARFYGCDVFSFDPSMGASFRRYDKVTFYEIGIGGMKGGLQRDMWRPQPGTNTHWRIESLTDIKYLLGHQNRTIDIFKIDTEGAEWPSIADMAAAGELSLIKQFVVEFHLWDGEKGDIARHELNVVADLARAGFKLFYSHMYAGWAGIPRLSNVYPVQRTITYEVSFINTRYTPPT